MLKNIIFDVDGVIREMFDANMQDILSEDEYKIYSEKLQYPTIKQFCKHCFTHNDFYYDYDKGLKTEEEYIDYFAKQEGLPKELFAKITEYRCYGHTIYSETLDLVKKLKEEGYNTYILSNMGKRLSSILKAKIDPSLFDDIIFSCDVHHAKPFIDMYEYAIDRLKINPAESLFIDDRQENLDPFKSLGGQTFLFDNKKLNETLVALYDHIKKNS